MFEAGNLMNFFNWGGKMRGLKFEGGYHTFTPTYLEVCELKVLVYVFYHLPFFLNIWSGNGQIDVEYTWMILWQDKNCL